MARFTGTGQKTVKRTSKQFTFEYTRPEDLRREGRTLALTVAGKRGGSTMVLNGHALRSLKAVMLEAGEIS